MFALVDCNNFFVSCERVFNPALEGKPVVVLSNNDGCVISRSDEAKKLGIAMGEPFFKIRTLYHQGGLSVFSANFNLYGDMSHRVMQVLEALQSGVEVYSIDEAFLDVSGLKGDTLSAYGKTIQQRIKRWTGIPVSVGIAKTKTLAKVANEIAKQSEKTAGVLNLAQPRHQERALARLPVGNVWGVGHRLAKSLEAAGIHTAWQLREASDSWILKRYGITLFRTIQELRGISCLPLTLQRKPRQSIMCSRSFGQLVEDLPTLKEAVSTYVSRAAEKLRQERLLAKNLTVYIRTSRFRQDPQYANAVTLALPIATDCSPELIQVAVKALEQIYRQGYRYYRACVTLTGLSPATQAQQFLFDPVDREKAKRLMSALDRVNAQWGRGTLKYAAEGLNPKWLMKQEHRSPCYTTHWEELPLVKT